MKAPGFRRRGNPRARRIAPPPAGVNLPQVAATCHYVGSVYHKDRPGFAGTPGSRRPDASLCPGNLANHRSLVETWLRDAVRAGHTGTWEKGFPRHVWSRQDGAVFEARQGSPGSGEYHGYPLEPWQHVRGLP